MVAVLGIRLHNIPQHIFSAYRLDDPFASGFLFFRKPLLLLRHNIHVFTLRCQIRSLHRIAVCQLLRDLLRALSGHFHVHRSGYHIAPGKFSPSGLAAQLCKRIVQRSCLVRVHLVLHARPCRGPRIRAVHPVCLIHHGVNSVAAKYQRYRPVLRVPFPGLHHRNGRRRHPAQLQRLAQVLLGQVVHRHQLLLSVHLHRCAKRKAHCFLHSCIVFLAFASIPCYTCLSRKARAFTALLGLEDRVSAFLFLFYMPLVVQHKHTAIRSAYFVHIKLVTLFCTAVLVHDHRFINGRSANRHRCHKRMGVVASSLPVFGGSNLFSIPDHIRDRRRSDLLHRSVPVLHSRLCTFSGKLYNTKAVAFHFSANGFKVPYNVLGIFLVGRSIRNFVARDRCHRLHPVQLFQVFIQLFFHRFLAFRKLEPHPLRRAVAFNGSGVFFCRPQIVHRLFCVRKIGILQSLLLRLGKVLCVQRRPVLRVDGQDLLCLADDAAQKLLHRVHGLGNGACLARVFVRLRPLELCPPGHVLHGLKNAAPAVGHQLLRCLFIGQVLGCVVLHLVPDHSIHVLVALALCQILQRPVHQRLCALRVQSVVPVEVLVQDRCKHIFVSIRKENASRLRVYVRLHPLAGRSVRPPQHAL